MRHFFLGILVMLALVGICAPVSALQLFPTEQQAQQHSPSDAVVWVNTATDFYHFKGERWYGNTKSGAFVCQAGADSAGARATKNGQQNGKCATHG